MRIPCLNRGAALAVAGGLLLASATPPWGLWPGGIAGIALLDRAIAGAPAWSRFRRGTLCGFALLIPTLSWIASFTVPGYALAFLYYSAALGTACVLVPARSAWRWVALPGTVVLWDATRGRWPFGGVPVSTLAVGHVDGPFVDVIRVGGPLLVGVAVASAGVAVSLAAARRWRPAAVIAAVLAAVVLVSATLAPRAHDLGTLEVGLVQGGGKQGTAVGEVDPAVVFQRHLAASALLPAGLDAVLWPEDVVDVDGSLLDSPEGAQIMALARRLRTTLMVGAVEGDPAGKGFRNAELAFGSDGTYLDRYDKVRRVPFGEYVPLRWLLEPLAGGSLRPEDEKSGADPAILRTPTGTFGVAISWEVWFADRVRAATRQGGEVLTNPTNGASFHGTIVQTQQLAHSRLRAMENDRWMLQAAPTGFTAVITPDGRVTARSNIGEQRVLVATVQRRGGLTLATRVGDVPAVVLSLAGIGFAWIDSRRRRNGRATPPATR